MEVRQGGHKGDSGDCEIDCRSYSEGEVAIEATALLHRGEQRWHSH